MIIVRGSCVSWQLRVARRARAPVCARPAPFAATRLAPPPSTAQHRPAPPSTAQHRTARDVNTMDPSAGMATTSRSRRKEDDKKPKRKPSPAKQNEDKLRLPDPSDAALDNLRTAFGLLDRDRDGHVTAAELQFMLRNLGIEVRDELIADLIQDASRTGNGLIDENEFMQWVSKMQALQGALAGAGAAPAQDSEEEITKDLLAAFRVFDRDRNGYITRDELRSALEMIGEPVTDAQLGQVIALADIDHDGRIDYEEFVKMLL